MRLGQVVRYTRRDGATFDALVIHFHGDAASQGSGRVNLVYVDGDAPAAGSLGAAVRVEKSVRHESVSEVEGPGVKDSAFWAEVVAAS